MTVQYIHDTDGTALFAVLPIDQYRRLLNGQEVVSTTQALVSADSRFVRLPYGGSNARLDVVKLIQYWLRGIAAKTLDVHMAINSRAQTLDQFPENQLDCTLDPLVRKTFLQGDGGYKNTMQVTGEVVDGLVATGVFSRCSKQYPGLFSRSVKALEIDPGKAKAFLEQHSAIEE